MPQSGAILPAWHGGALRAPRNTTGPRASPGFLALRRDAPTPAVLRSKTKQRGAGTESRTCGACHGARQSLRGGFTLVEIIVVTAIIGLLLATGVPALSRYANSVRLKAAVRETVGLFSLARSQAISSRRERTVIVDPELGQLRIDEPDGTKDPRIVRLPSSLEVTVEQQGHVVDPGEPIYVVFRTTGALVGVSTSVIFSNGTHSQKVRVTSTTGAVFVQ